MNKNFSKKVVKEVIDILKTAKTDARDTIKSNAEWMKSEMATVNELKKKITDLGVEIDAYTQATNGDASKSLSLLRDSTESKLENARFNINNMTTDTAECKELVKVLDYFIGLVIGELPK